MTSIPILEIIYILAIVVTCILILYNTKSQGKTLAYILLVCFVPIIGMIIYFMFGFNYHRSRVFSNMDKENLDLLEKLNVNIHNQKETLEKVKERLGPDQIKMSNYIFRSTYSPITTDNKVELLVNGEVKFPKVYNAIKSATHHIHIEYYIYNDDDTGKKLADLLIEKAKSGVSVKFIYDDFGSKGLGGMVDSMKKAGISAEPFYEIKYMLFANRINYRNHRKIIVVDGIKGFVGGINVSNEYVNDPELNNDKFWRDTHLYIEGPGVEYLQYTFLKDWNFCNGIENINDLNVKPIKQEDHVAGDCILQIAACGPDTPLPNIEYSMLQAIYSAKKYIKITTPYFIPGESIMDALVNTAMSGVEVELLVPAKSDSLLVDFAAKSYYSKLLENDVRIYFYEKGFLHSKTMVIDDEIAIIGSANMDHRSFDLNFEVNTVIFDPGMSRQVRHIFEKDKEVAKQVDKDNWKNRSKLRQFPEKLARLISPIL